MNSVFGIKNTEFNSSFKKITKIVCLATSKARWHWPSLWTTAFGKFLSSMAVVVDNDLWQIFKFNGRRPQRRLYDGF